MMQRSGGCHQQISAIGVAMSSHSVSAAQAQQIPVLKKKLPHILEAAISTARTAWHTSRLCTAICTSAEQTGRTQQATPGTGARAPGT